MKIYKERILTLTLRTYSRQNKTNKTLNTHTYKNTHTHTLLMCNKEIDYHTQSK